MAVANVKHARLCAFCKYWYDPTNAYIKPRNPRGGFWEYDPNARAVCQIWGLPKRANAACPKFEPKVVVPK
jgi:hypothetical protein